MHLSIILAKRINTNHLEGQTKSMIARYDMRGIYHEYIRDWLTCQFCENNPNKDCSGDEENRKGCRMRYFQHPFLNGCIYAATNF